MLFRSRGINHGPHSEEQRKTHLDLVILRGQPLAEVAQLLRELGHFLLAERRVVVASDRVFRADVAYALFAVRDLSLVRLAWRQYCM